MVGLIAPCLDIVITGKVALNPGIVWHVAGHSRGFVTSLVQVGPQQLRNPAPLKNEYSPRPVQNGIVLGDGTTRGGVLLVVAGRRLIRMGGVY